GFDLDQTSARRSCQARRVTRNPCVRIASGLALFQGISERRVAMAARKARLVQLDAGQALVRRGAKLPGLCAVGSGSLKLSVWARPRAERVLGLVAAGESFGEAAALAGVPAPFDAVAVVQAQVLAIPAEALEMLLRTDRRFARNLVERLA